MTALVWCFLVSLVIGTLIYLEQIPILYVLATLGLVFLLVVVGFSDLENVGKDNAEVFAAREE